MIRGEELMCGLINCGRRATQDFVVRSPDVSDALTYLQTELLLEMIKVTSFITTNLKTFERRKALSSCDDQAAMIANPHGNRFTDDGL